MNREILFRGKRVDNGEWVEGDLIHTVVNFNPSTQILHWKGNSDNEHSSEVITSTIGQFTGLTDKNGVKIFEGDILRKPADLWICNESVGDKKGTFDDDAFVECHDGTFRINQIGNEAKLYYGVINYSRNTGVDVMEVIGNIHDNPELIK